MSFGFSFTETKVCVIENINYSIESGRGTCKLKSPSDNYFMTWDVVKYPMENEGMPGSPYPIKFSFTIGQKNKLQQNHVTNSISGQLIYEVNSGTFLNLSPMGIGYGDYYVCAFNNKTGNVINLLFKISEYTDNQVYFMVK
jgi:hypothetical protein